MRWVRTRQLFRAAQKALGDWLRRKSLMALEISSFKCGHDAPIYGVIEGIIEQSGSPYFCFKDLDENKPSGSIRI